MAMAMATERPPSERGIEYQLADAVTALTERLDALRPVAPVNPVNWWDVLPANAPVQMLRQIGHYEQRVLVGWAPNQIMIGVRAMPDRIELTLSGLDGTIFWQRCLFYPGEQHRG